MDNLTRILSIDGGGIRGLIQAQVLLELERIIRKKTGNKYAKIADYFDLISGTSTGGILTCIYLCPDKRKPELPRFSAKQAVNFYTKYGHRIFPSKKLRKIVSMNGILTVKYSASNLEKLLRRYFGNLLLSNLVKPSLITAYDLQENNTVFFTQHTAKERPEEDFFIRDVARSTSAAPTFFKPAKIYSRTHESIIAIDGGVFANNPALCAYSEACKLGFSDSIEDMAILSLGSGIANESYTYGKVKNWGGIKWAGHIAGLMMAGTSETVDYELNKLYQSVNKKAQYLRIDPVLDKRDPGTIKMDNASPENIKKINEIGKATAKENFSKLSKFADLLINSNVKMNAGTTRLG